MEKANIFQNRFIKGFKQLPYGEPTYLGFTILFDFDGDDSPLFNTSRNSESAHRYLINVGETKRADLLLQMKSILQSIVRNEQYYFQTINGLDNLMVNLQGSNFDTFRGKDKIIGLDTLESLDLKISSIKRIWESLYFDYSQMKMVLPYNLRKFSMNVIISDIRRFHKPSPQTDKFNLEPLNLSSIINFRLSECELVVNPEENVYLGSLDNNSTEFIKNKISFSVKKIHKIDEFSLMDLIVDDYKDGMFSSGDNTTSRLTPSYRPLFDWNNSRDTLSLPDRVFPNITKVDEVVIDKNVYDKKKESTDIPYLQTNKRLGILETNLSRALNNFGIPTSVNALADSLRNAVRNELYNTIYVKNVYKDNPNNELRSAVSGLLGNVFNQQSYE